MFAPEVTATVRELRRGKGPSYLVLTRTQKAWGEESGVWPDGALDVLESSLASQPGWSTFLTNADITIWRYAAPASAGAGGAHHA